MAAHNRRRRRRFVLRRCRRRRRRLARERCERARATATSALLSCTRSLVNQSVGPLSNGGGGFANARFT